MSGPRVVSGACIIVRQHNNWSDGGETGMIATSGRFSSTARRLEPIETKTNLRSLAAAYPLGKISGTNTQPATLV